MGASEDGGGRGESGERTIIGGWIRGGD